MTHEFMHMVTDPAHLAFEVFSTLLIEVVGLGLAWPVIKRLVRRHDRRNHG